MSRAATQPVLAGVVAALVGFASTFALVLAGLRAVGADAQEAASGLVALCVLMGVAGIWLGLRTRLPITTAWSTPGAALLISTGSVSGGYAAALGAFAVTGALIVLAGLWAPLGRWIASIPTALASAMLAGVLLPVCLAPVRAVVELPWQAGPVVLVWVLLTRCARRWAVPGALAAAAVAVVADPGAGAPAGDLAPALQFTVPHLTAGAVLGLAVPLFVITMASQNVPGMAVLAGYGYRPRLRPILVLTGGATAVGAPFGAHAINLAAITAALAAGPDADPDPARRWIASVSAGVTYVALGLGAGLVAAAAAVAPPLLVEAVAGLALIGALGAALAGALGVDEQREAAIITFVVSASAVTVLGISAPFWGLVAGLAFLGVQRAGAVPGRAAREPV